jgi:hypothetical protein
MGFLEAQGDHESMKREFPGKVLKYSWHVSNEEITTTIGFMCPKMNYSVFVEIDVSCKESYLMYDLKWRASSTVQDI